MRTARNLSFLFFICVVIVVQMAEVEASVACSVTPAQCSPGATRRWGCGFVIEGPGGGSPQHCADVTDICNSYCSEHGGVDTKDCPSSSIGSVASCLCKTTEQCPSGCGSCDQSEDCCTGCGLAWNYDIGACDTSPILLNLENNRANYHLTSVEDGVLFDLAASGTPIRTAWTDPAHEIAFLVLDRNLNGFIDDGSELFGSATRNADGSRAANGFDALLDVEREAGTGDGTVDSSDAVYSQLGLWVDRNHNGHSESSEHQSCWNRLYTDLPARRR